MLRIAEDDWQIMAECPGTETQYIKGLKSKADVDEWLAGTRVVQHGVGAPLGSRLCRYGHAFIVVSGRSTVRIVVMLHGAGCDSDTSVSRFGHDM
jgi:hypothetical protein